MFEIDEALINGLLESPLRLLRGYSAVLLVSQKPDADPAGL
jgi:preprotein translocase subunit Sss1